MSVTAILARADKLGVQIHAVGDDLKARWSANEPPPPDLIAALKANKPAILAALSAPSDAGGWRDYFEERAAIREHDGGLSRTDAEAGAFADCVARWRALNPLPASGDGACVQCGKARPDTPVLARGGHVWLHRECLAPMHAERDDIARRAGGVALGLPSTDAEP